MKTCGWEPGHPTPIIPHVPWDPSEGPYQTPTLTLTVPSLETLFL